jgi:hypothetical protein
MARNHKQIKPNTMSTKIKSKKITETKNKIKGYFLLTDKSKTFFEIDKQTKDWFQWGNCTDNLCLSVNTLENIIYQLN